MAQQWEHETLAQRDVPWKFRNIVCFFQQISVCNPPNPIYSLKIIAGFAEIFRVSAFIYMVSHILNCLFPRKGPEAVGDQVPLIRSNRVKKQNKTSP